jgi:hypothetical protein
LGRLNLFELANKKISDLAAASALSGPELFEVLQGGVNKKVSASGLIGSSLFVDDETPTGDIDDINDTFTLANTPITGSVKVYQNGIRLRATVDYNISGTTITFLTPPTTGDIILCDYRR